MTKIEISQIQRRLFIDTFCIGNEVDSKEETLELINFVKFLRPNVFELSIFEVEALMKLNKFTEALELIEKMILERSDNPIYKAQAAYCLFRKHDPQWQYYADQVRAMPRDETAFKLITDIEDFKLIK
jgi:Bacterial type III secretion protein (HrpB1_HrpK)